MSVALKVVLIVLIGTGYFVYERQRRKRIRRAIRREAVAHPITAAPLHPGAREVDLVASPPVHIAETNMPVTAVVHEPIEQNVELLPADRSNITETGMMIYFANDSRGQKDKEYRFNFKKVGNGWRAYILRMPHLGDRSSDGAIIHRLHDNIGFYICWDSNVDTLKDMQAIARIWADSIQGYIYTGTFGP